MFILGFSIPVLVLYFKYKKVQTSGKRTAIIILNILLSVFSFFSLIDLLITIIGGSLLNSDYIDKYTNRHEAQAIIFPM